MEQADTAAWPGQRIGCPLRWHLGVRGDGKAPGQFRQIPNWIGAAGCAIEQARFVPIGADKLGDALSSWEKFLHSEQPDHLVQLAIAHAEFESLHPFLDGNGRLGRILIPLMLWDRRLIRKPMFYLSAYLEANRDEYYERLLSISRDGDWTGWCEFFLKGIQSQAEDNIAKAQGILELYEELKRVVADWKYGIVALDWIFAQPLFKTSTFIQNVQIPDATARRLVNQLKDHGLLYEVREASGRRPAILVLSRLLNIAEGHAMFPVTQE